MGEIIDFIKGNKDYFENFVTRSTYHSNGIEGNTLSYAETYAIIFNDNEFTVNAKPRELYEAINHKYALDYLFHHVGEPLSEKMIKDLGQIVNKNINEIEGYRKEPVMIRGVEHIPPEPEKVPQAMMYFVYNISHTDYENIFVKLADMHINFERIHPFSDGNGRTGRLLLNYELLRENYAPIVIPKEERSQYFQMLAACDLKAMSSYFKDLETREVEILRKLGFQKDTSLKKVRESNVGPKL
ncbi:Fic family protein [Clostridium sp. C105KSO13]|uniref:Fic family protein n=1 Tax=Clostridium sp. C105KSO13 TaxID=1776045 RepID=UPI00074073FA|nr:Fic family protein [Clostridium sp. C105KSO13]CUX28203.1 Fic/DOC family protein [Clostridium sp. C105KSO13]